MIQNSDKKTNIYFGEDEENAIKEYISCKDRTKREELYVKYIKKAFSEMVDKIVYTYRFTVLPDIDSLREECKIWLMTIIGEYDIEKGKKAFSYFSTITKNWFLYHIKKMNKTSSIEVDSDFIYNLYNNDFLISNAGLATDPEAERVDLEMWKCFVGELEKWKDCDLKETERRVLDAIIIITKSIDDIEIFNKKAFYFYIREITGYNTKQIVTGLNRLRKKYTLFKIEWASNGFIL